MKSPEKLKWLREALKRNNLTALIIPSNDPHQSEYVAAHWKAREWITAFTGSAGVAVVTQDAAGLWTDSRYYLQAEQELQGTDVTFHQQVVAGAAEHHDWLKQRLKPGDRIGVDGKLLSIEGLHALESDFAGTGVEIVTDADPVAEAWLNRPPLPMTPIFLHPAHLAGRSASEKLAAIRAEMTRLGADHHLVVTLDDIAWTFNLRGRDVAYNPVFYAYALISKEAATLFVEPAKLTPTVLAALAEAGVEAAAYEAWNPAMAQLSGTLLLDPAVVSVAVAQQTGPNCTILHGPSPSTRMKAKKDAVEVAHIRKAMEKDGVALLRLCRWLESQVASGQVTEHAVGERLASFRAAQPGYFGESFPAIAGYAGNGAIVHYRPDQLLSAILKPEGVFLLDSGGQYEDGTTDITRTFALGVVPEAAKTAYTLVLKGHVAIAKAQFPSGTMGYQLDPLARVHVWSAGMNYGHGTGHGVGYFLNVHEGPQGIGPVANGRSRVALEPGMVISNEPGYYEAGQFGIRIENLVLCVERGETHSGKFLAFETLSLFPIESTLIDWGLMERAELEWLRNYHLEVMQRLNPHLSEEEQHWLREKCIAYLL